MVYYVLDPKANEVVNIVWTSGPRTNEQVLSLFEGQGYKVVDKPTSEQMIRYENYGKPEEIIVISPPPEPDPEPQAKSKTRRRRRGQAPAAS